MRVGYFFPIKEKFEYDCINQQKFISFDRNELNHFCLLLPPFFLPKYFPFVFLFSFFIPSFLSFYFLLLFFFLFFCFFCYFPNLPLFFTFSTLSHFLFIRTSLFPLLIPFSFHCVSFPNPFLPFLSILYLLPVPFHCKSSFYSSFPTNSLYVVTPISHNSFLVTDSPLSFSTLPISLPLLFIPSFPPSFTIYSFLTYFSLTFLSHLLVLNPLHSHSYSSYLIHRYYRSILSLFFWVFLPSYHSHSSFSSLLFLLLHFVFLATPSFPPPLLPDATSTFSFLPLSDPLPVFSRKESHLSGRLGPRCPREYHHF